MVSHSSSRRQTNVTSSGRTAKHKIPKNHINNIFVKNIRQQRLRKNVLKKYYKNVKNINKLRDTGKGRVQIRGKSANHVFPLCNALTRHGNFCQNRATSSVKKTDGTTFHVCWHHNKMIQMSRILELAGYLWITPSHIEGKQANGSSMNIPLYRMNNFSEEEYI